MKYEGLSQLAATIKNTGSCVVLTGAGISAESGVPTFRGKEGLWGKFRAEELATMEAFSANSRLVWEWYNWRRDLMKNVKPNPGHLALTDLEQMLDHFVLITQNVDGLHRRAETQSILELHGNIYRNKCVECDKPYTGSDEINPDNIPTCILCGGKIRPDVVWFGEMLNPKVIDQAFLESERADVFLVVGTSAIVHPAASLPETAKRHGATVAEVNLEETPLTSLADYHFSAAAGEFLPDLVR